MNEETQNTVESKSQEGLEALLNNFFVSFLIDLLIAIVVVTGLIIVSKIIANTIRNKVIENSISGDDEYAGKVGDLISSMIFYALAIFSVVIGFQIIGFDLGWLLGGLSVGLGFAFREVLGNMLAGVMLLTTKEFKLGDIIEINSKDLYFGTIEEITVRYVVLRTLDFRRVIVPNLELITNPVTTFTSEEILRLSTNVVVHYDTDLDKAMEVAKNAVNNLEFIAKKDETSVLVSDLQDSNNGGTNGILLKIYFHMEQSGNLISTAIPISEVNKAINNSFKENGITIPYPHTSVTVDKNDKNLLGSAMYLMNKNKKQSQ